MACSLTTSLQLACRDSVGGLKEIKLRNHPGLSVIANDVTVTSGVATISGSQGTRSSWYTVSLEKETCTYDENDTTNIPNGTTFYEQVLTIIFNKFSAKIRNEVAIYNQTSVWAAVKDMNNNCWLIGTDYGADVTSGKTSFGTARGDRNGHTATFTAKETQKTISIANATYDLLVT